MVGLCVGGELDGVVKCLSVTKRHLPLVTARVFLFAQFVLMLRIVGVFAKPVAAAAIGAVLCVATVAVFVTALGLANMDRLNEKKLPGLKASVESTIDESTGATVEKDSADMIEAGPSQGHECPADEEKVEQHLDVMPWSSILSIGSGALCGAEPADETASSVLTGQASFDELASMAIAAGVKQSEVSRLALALSKQLSSPVAPNKF